MVFGKPKNRNERNNMRKTIEQIIEENNLPKTYVGQVTSLENIWDGEGETPDSSYSYKVDDTTWVNYEFVTTWNRFPCGSNEESGRQECFYCYWADGCGFCQSEKDEPSEGMVLITAIEII